MPNRLIPLSYGEGAFTEKRSKFTGRVWHVETEADALGKIREMRETYWDATHNVYAYSVDEGSRTRYSDDGEPSGTSGMPVLNVFRAREITDFCCVVTRYFGGILLGAGGLVRAYSKAATLALDNAGTAELRELITFEILASYSQYERLKPELARLGVITENVIYGADVEISALVEPRFYDKLNDRVTELTSGTALIERTGTTSKPVPVSENYIQN